ncbi:FAD-binding protein [Sphingobium sp. JS3065]|jgi:glycolate oxidase FAD binding subunit|uniref:FAD-binding protein n=1 Tax=unclassified Sphingobium TaxID=2611147 RepID=UPI0004C3763D|nr:MULTISPECIES: FAD-binding protein [unclassified Sphingobium]UZW57056.1 FAD-binding protein [Sphingobium sp. JS3065]
MTNDLLKPGDEAEAMAMVADAAARESQLSIEGGGTKSCIGRSVEAQILSMQNIAGVIDYDPAELVLTVRPGTALAEVEALVESQGQMLAFEPFDHSGLFPLGGRATIGGVVAAGVAGSRRVSAGGARDHLLGLRAVSGRGEIFVAGAKVVKNVTGYDLPKLAAGSWGRLFAMTELTLKVLPRPETSLTHVVEGVDGADLSTIMATAMGSQAAVAAVAHVPADLYGGRSITAIRLEGFGPSVRARSSILARTLGPSAPLLDMSGPEADAFWAGIRDLRYLPGDRTVWRINIPPRALQPLLSALLPRGASWVADWAGGLVWIALDGAAEAVRDAAQRNGGHAMLLRASERMRAETPTFHPSEPALAALEGRVRRAFDPLGLFETGRF